jgi:response regulator RpfG family c-di-GMP phosphodiesterase
MMIADGINDDQEGLFSEVHFTRQQLKELKAAAWLHDVGKIVTPQHIVDKATKLTTVHDRLELVQLRYALLQEQTLRAGFEDKLSALEPDRAKSNPTPEVEEIDQRVQSTCQQLQEELEVIIRCNLGSETMRNTDLQTIHGIKNSGTEHSPRLTDDEVLNLTVQRGTLTETERDIVRHHAQVTLDILSTLPFARHLRDVPEIAASHHEKLNGTGYPRGLTADQLSTRARILAVADIFEALTASDRPYRGPAPLSQAIGILEQMVENGEIDRDIVHFARYSGIFDKYARTELLAHQIDIQLGTAL